MDFCDPTAVSRFKYKTSGRRENGKVRSNFIRPSRGEGRFPNPVSALGVLGRDVGGVDCG